MAFSSLLSPVPRGASMAFSSLLSPVPRGASLLFQSLARASTFSEGEAARLASQIVSAVAHLVCIGTAPWHSALAQRIGTAHWLALARIGPHWLALATPRL